MIQLFSLDSSLLRRKSLRLRRSWLDYCLSYVFCDNINLTFFESCQHNCYKPTLNQCYRNLHIITVCLHVYRTSSFGLTGSIEITILVIKFHLGPLIPTYWRLKWTFENTCKKTLLFSNKAPFVFKSLGLLRPQRSYWFIP